MSLETAVLQQVKAEIRAVIAGKTLEAWTAVFANLDVCVEPVLTIPEMVEHPHTQERGLIVNVPKPEGNQPAANRPSPQILDGTTGLPVRGRPFGCGHNANPGRGRLYSRRN